MKKGPLFEIPKGTPQAICRGCGVIIYWIETRRGKKMPVDPDGVSHFATCPDGPVFRKRRTP